MIDIQVEADEKLKMADESGSSRASSFGILNDLSEPVCGEGLVVKKSEDELIDGLYDIHNEIEERDETLCENGEVNLGSMELVTSEMQPTSLTTSPIPPSSPTSPLSDQPTTTFPNTPCLQNLQPITSKHSETDINIDQSHLSNPQQINDAANNQKIFTTSNPENSNNEANTHKSKLNGNKDTTNITESIREKTKKTSSITKNSSTSSINSMRKRLSQDES